MQLPVAVIIPYTLYACLLPKIHTSILHKLIHVYYYFLRRLLQNLYREQPEPVGGRHFSTHIQVDENKFDMDRRSISLKMMFLQNLSHPFFNIKHYEAIFHHRELSHTNMHTPVQIFGTNCQFDTIFVCIYIDNVNEKIQKIIFQTTMYYTIPESRQSSLRLIQDMESSSTNLEVFMKWS